MSTLKEQVRCHDHPTVRCRDDRGVVAGSELHRHTLGQTPRNATNYSEFA